MRTRSCRSADALLLQRECSPYRPHNLRYVEVPAQRAQTLAVKCGEAPQCRSSTHPLRVVRAREPLRAVDRSASSGCFQNELRGRPQCDAENPAWFSGLLTIPST